MGCEGDFVLGPCILSHLDSFRIHYLDQIKGPPSHHMPKNDWFQAEDLGLRGGAVGDWSRYIKNFCSIGIKLSNSANTIF